MHVFRIHVCGGYDCCGIYVLQAGFIILATTNLSELCMWYESNNKVYGRTNNAYNGRRIVGGSSGGEAALISAAGAPCGIGVCMCVCVC